MAWLPDLVLAVLLLEAAALGWLARRGGRGVPFADVVGSLLAGLFLVLALREAVSGTTGWWLAGWLAAAGAAHAFDLRRRWMLHRTVPPVVAGTAPSVVSPG